MLIKVLLLWGNGIATLGECMRKKCTCPCALRGLPDILTSELWDLLMIDLKH